MVGIQRYIKTWQIDTPTSINIENVIVKGCTFDKNGGSNSVPGAPFAWEQCHVFDWQSSHWASITVNCKSIQFIDLEILDMVAGGIHLATQAHVGEFYVDRFFGNGQSSGKFGFRSDIEPTLFCTNQTIINSTMVSLQNEPVPPFEPTTANPRHYYINNCNIDTVQISSTAGAVGPDSSALIVVIENTKVNTEFSIRSGIVRARDCKLKFKIPTWGPSQNYKDCDILFNESGGVSTHVQLEPRETGTFIFDTCKFKLDAVGPVTGHQLRVTQLAIGQSPDFFTVKLLNCETSPLVTNVINAGGAGTLIVEDSIMRNNGGYVCVVGNATRQGAFKFKNNEFPDISSSYIFNDQGFASNLATLRFEQELDLGLMVANSQAIDRAGTVVSGSTTINRAYAYSDVNPNTLGLNSMVGTKVYTNTPLTLGFQGWICVTAGSPGTWKTFGVISA